MSLKFLSVVERTRKTPSFFVRCRWGIRVFLPILVAQGPLLPQPLDQTGGDPSIFPPCFGVGLVAWWYPVFKWPPPTFFSLREPFSSSFNKVQDQRRFSSLDPFPPRLCNRAWVEFRVYRSLMNPPIQLGHDPNPLIFTHARFATLFVRFKWFPGLSEVLFGLFFLFFHTFSPPPFPPLPVQASACSFFPSNRPIFLSCFFLFFGSLLSRS